MDEITTHCSRSIHNDEKERRVWVIANEFATVASQLRDDKKRLRAIEYEIAASLCSSQ